MLKVIGAGFGRTGTLSQKAALDELGFGPCHHMAEVFGKARHIELWQAAADGQSIDWDELFVGYNSAVDWPACAFYEQLMRTYPDATVILNVRDPERWYESAMNTIYQVSKVMNSDSTSDPITQQHGRMINTLIWQNTFGGRFEDKSHAIAVFERHIQEVKERVPSERLLVFDVKQGWEPLCRFLGVAVPADKPFPHLNDTASFQERIQRLASGEAV